MSSTYINAVKAANEKRIHSISAIPAPTANNATTLGDVRNWFRSTTPAAQRLGTLMAPDIGIQSVALSGDNLVLLTGLGTNYMPAVNDDAVDYSVGDSYNLVPYYSAKADITKYVYTVIPAGLVEDTFYHPPQTLDTLAPIAAGPPGGLERFNTLNYDATDPDSFPVLVLIPMVCKLGFEHAIKSNSSVTAMDIANEDFIKGTTLEAYITGMKWLVENNGGNSLHHGTDLFDIATVTWVDANVPGTNNLSVTCNFAPFMHQVPIDVANVHETTVKRVQSTIMMACMNGGVMVSDTPPETTPQTVIKTTTMTESLASERNQGFQTIWSLMLARTDSNGKAIPAELSDTLLKAYKEKNAALSCQSMTSSFRDFIITNLQELLGHRGSSFTMKHDELYPWLVKSILEAKMYADNLRLNPEYVKKDITIFCFLKSILASTEYETIIKGGQTMVEAVSMAPGSNNIPTGSSTLYVNGSCTKIEDALAGLTNLEAFFLLLVKDPKNKVPYIVELIRQCYDLIGNMQSRRSFESMTDGPNGNPFFVGNFLLDVHMTLSQIMMFAFNPEVRELASANGDITPPFEKAMKNAQAVLESVRYAFQTGKLHEMNERPRLFDFLADAPTRHQSTPPPKGGDSNGGSNNQSPGSGKYNNSSPAKKQKKDNNRSPTSVATNNNGGSPPTAPGSTTRGLIKMVNGETKLPTLPTSILGMNPAKGNAMCKLCRLYITEGHSCGKTDCPYTHINSSTFHKRITDLEHQKAFCAFVKDAANYDWVGRELKPRKSGQ